MENLSNTKKISFVYNAKNDLGSKILDFGHKIIRPESYACELCSLTYGNFGMKTEWKSFLEKYPSINFEFLYRNEILTLTESELPCVLNEQGQIIISKKDFQEVKNLEELILRLEKLI